MNEWAEKAAVARLRVGDIRGLAALVEAHQVKAARVAYLIVRDTALAQDIVQAAFVRFYERIAGYDSHRPFAPYFMRMVVNDALAAVKRRDRSRSLNTSPSFSPVSTRPASATRSPMCRRRPMAIKPVTAPNGSSATTGPSIMPPSIFSSSASKRR